MFCLKVARLQVFHSGGVLWSLQLLELEILVSTGALLTETGYIDRDRIYHRCPVCLQPPLPLAHKPSDYSYIKKLCRLCLILTGIVNSPLTVAASDLYGPLSIEKRN